MLILLHFAGYFIDCVLDSIVLQEARRDLINGQQDMVLFRQIGFGVGAVSGCAISAYFIEYYTCFHCWIFCASVSLISLIGSFLLPAELETNEFATQVT